jgi:putative DNA primase/helicase
VKCVPFKVEIVGDEIDKDLPDKLRTELPGILRWIIEGAVLYHREGLGDPPDVVAATEQYRQESDRLKEFFEDCCVLAHCGNEASWKKERWWVPAVELYTAYSSWAEAMGNKYPLSKDNFDDRLLKQSRIRGRERPEGGRKSNQVRVWLGIRLKTAEGRLGGV